LFFSKLENTFRVINMRRHKKTYFRIFKYRFMLWISKYLFCNNQFVRQTIKVIFGSILKLKV
jgi:hypothetical protein